MALNSTKLTALRNAFNGLKTKIDDKAAVNHNHTGVYEPADAAILKDADIGSKVLAPNGDGSQLVNLPYIEITQSTIGTPGQPGFGVGICPGPLPAGMNALPGYDVELSDNYGNYQHSDGSIMVWIPAFFYKWGANNSIDIQPRDAYGSVAEANAAGYALHRAFYDGGEREGFFIDKYLGSNSLGANVAGGIFSSIRLGIPCDTNGSQSGVAQISGVGANNYGMVQQAAKSRGDIFHGASIFMHKALAMLSYAHGQASTGAAYCAWHDAINNFPKGCNNNALGDTNDSALTFVGAGHASYSSKPLAGSANTPAKTAHNGQACGVVDLNGSMWEVAYGLTSDGSTYYALNTSKRLRDLTGSNDSGADSLFGAAGITANYDPLGATVGVLGGSNAYTTFGSASPVFDAATSGTAWQATGAGMPIAEGGTNAFGNDGIWDYRPNQMCPIVGAGWDSGSGAGVWALLLYGVRTGASNGVGGRAACYL